MDIQSGNINIFIDQVFNSFKEKGLKIKDYSSLKKVHLNNNESLYLLDLFQNKIIYKKGFFSLLGYDDNIITFEFLFNNFHPDDSEIVHRISKNAILYLIDHPGNDNSQLFITYRHKTKDDTYIKVLNQITVFDVNKNGILKTLLIRLTDITFMDHTDNVNWTFKTDNLNENEFKKIIYKIYHNFFSKREIQVIDKISKKLSNKEIGQQLHISEQTVASHRKNIFKKANCHNPEELIVFCKGKGLL